VGARKMDLSEIDLRTLPKDERPKPTTGQSGTPIDLEWSAMNGDEQLVAQKLYEGTGAQTIGDLAAKGFGKENPKLRVRNSMRRLVRGGWVEWAGRGKYKLTATGRRRYERSDDKPAAKSGGKVVSIDSARKAKAEKANGNGHAKAGSGADKYAKIVREKIAKPTDEVLKTGMIVLAAKDHGLKDSKVSAATGLSRGFVIKRVKRLKAAGIDLASAKLGDAIDIANGVEA
jgi:hypothetical protein